MFFIFENSRISEVLDFRHVFSPSFLGLLATTKLKREDLRISNDPPFFSVNICGIKLKVILSRSIAEILNKNE